MAKTSTQKDRPGEKMLGVCRRLRQDILSGQISLGARLPTEKQLSSQHGFSATTAAGVVTRLADEGLAVRIRGSGSFVADRLPNRRKILDVVRLRSEGGGRSKAIGLTWAEHLSDVSGQHGWKPCWHYISENDREGIEQLIEELSDSKGVLTFGLVPMEIPSLVWNAGVPVVTVRAVQGGLGEKAQAFPQLSFYRAESARMATEHLLSLGHSRLGFIWEPHSLLRLNGFLDVARRHGLTLPSEWLMEIQDPYKDTSDLCAKVQQLLKSQDRPRAICCCSDFVAYCVRSTAMNLGLRVPEDLALVACDEHRLGDAWDPVDEVGITKVAMSSSEVWEKALELLEKMSGQPRGKADPLLDPVMMPLYLTVKDTCGGKSA